MPMPPPDWLRAGNPATMPAPTRVALPTRPPRERRSPLRTFFAVVAVAFVLGPVVLGATWLVGVVGQLVSDQFGGAGAQSDGVAHAEDDPGFPFFLSNAKLPTPRWGTSAVWTGTYAMVFGGTDITTRFDDILRYDPLRDEITVMQSRFPTGLTSTAAVQAGDRAFIFGGFTSMGTYSDQIFRYDPGTDTLETMRSVLPRAVGSASAVWTGEKVIVFGGYNEAVVAPDILLYDPIADSITTSKASLPRPTVFDTRGLALAAVAWDGAYAYAFGGYSPRGWTSQVLRYDPRSDQIESLAASGSSWEAEPWSGSGSNDQGALPDRMGYTPGIWDGQQVLLFGGSLYASQTRMDGETSNGVLSFRPDSRAVATIDHRLPSPTSGASAVWSDRAGFLFGGAAGETMSDQILVYMPSKAGRYVS